MSEHLEKFMKKNPERERLITNLSKEQRKVMNEKLSKIPLEHMEGIDRWVRGEVKEFADLGVPINSQAKIYHEFILNEISKYLVSKRKD